MSAHEHPNDRDASDPFVDVDNARERPRRIDRLADQPDTGDLTDNQADIALEPGNDDADIVPGDKTDIHERGTIITPPG